MVDLLRLFNKEVYNKTESDEYYLSHVLILQKSYAMNLGEQLHLKKDSIQIDLEDAIAEMIINAQMKNYEQK